MKVGNTISNTSADKWQGMGKIYKLKNELSSRNWIRYLILTIIIKRKVK